MAEDDGYRDYLEWMGRVRRAAAGLRSAGCVLPAGGASPASGGHRGAAGARGSRGRAIRPAALRSEATRPRVSVVTPARNAGPWVAEAVASVLLQEGVDLEMIVVDDASTDDTRAVLEAVDDPRLRLLHVPAHRGIGHAHNRGLERARGDLVVHLDADDVLLRGALRSVTRALARRPDAAHAWAWHVQADAACRVEEGEWDRQRDFLAAQARFHPDVRRALLVHGMVTNPLRTYRREVFEEVGPFHEGLPWAVDYDMAVRVATRFEGVGVPRVLYVQRVHDRNAQQTLPLRGVRSWAARARICHRRLREGGGRLLGRGAGEVYGLQLLGLVHQLGLPRLARAMVPRKSRVRMGRHP